MSATPTLSPISPSDEELLSVLRSLRVGNPTLGVSKFHALLLKDRPSWAVSEKRFRKVLQQNGLNSIKAAETGENAVADETDESEVYPIFRISEGLDVTKWTNKVEVEYFGRKKGKGLAAKEKFEEGEVIWKEDPWIIAPEWDIFNAQVNALTCMYCTTPLPESRLVVSCPSQPCTGRFCNRLCLTKSLSVHPLMCRGQNPAIGPLLDFAKRGEWLGLHALAQQTAKIIIANEKGDNERELQWRIVRGFAEMGMEQRVRANRQTASTRDKTAWKSAHKLFIQAFCNPVDEAYQKKLARLRRRPLPSDMEQELFSYDGFLRGLGRMNLNLEAHGGLYVLHSHLNHSCTPNASVRHFDQRTALSRITVVALEDISPGQEILITYVNPTAPILQRRRTLREWGFGDCQCKRCLKEATELPAEENQPVSASANGEGSSSAGDSRIDKADLEHELREGFGL